MREFEHLCLDLFIFTKCYWFCHLLCEQLITVPVTQGQDTQLSTMKITQGTMSKNIMVYN